MRHFFACLIMFFALFPLWGQSCVAPAADMVVTCGTTFCQGDTICVQNNSLDDAITTYYLWEWGPEFGPLETSDEIFVKKDTFFVFDNQDMMNNPTNCFIIRLLAVNDCGGGVIEAGNNSTLINITTPPNAFIIDGNIESCLPDGTIVFPNNSDSPDVFCIGSAPIEYLWDFGNGDFSTEENPVYTYTEPGVYDVILTVSNNATSKSCNSLTGSCPDPDSAPSCGMDSDTIQVIIYPEMIPIADVPQTACTQEVLNLTSDSFCGFLNNASCIDSLIWSFSPNVNFVMGTNQNSEDPDIIFQTPTTHNVTLTLFSEDDCPPVDTSFIIEVFEGVGVTSQDTTACETLTFRPFDLINLSGSSPDTVAWDLGTQGIFNTVDPGEFTFSGSQTISLTVGNSCNLVVENIQVNIIIPDVGQIDQADFEICANDPPLPLTASPAGSDWNGSGIASDGTFDPASANIGLNTIVYGGFCVEPDTILIQVNDLPSVDPGMDLIVCIEDASVPLAGLPAGGDWVFDGDTLTLPLSPNFPGIGIHTLEYQITDPLTLCTNRDSIQIQIDSVPSLSVQDTIALCISSNDVDLQAIVGVVESDENELTWSGSGIVNGQTGIFNSSGLAAGFYEIALDYNVNACPVADTLIINLTNAELAMLGPDIQVCINDGTLSLSATPANGTFSGLGIDPASGIIDLNAALAGNGEYIYRVFPGTTCENRDTIQVDIINLDNLMVSDQSICETVPTFTLTASPGGGVWSGNPALLNPNTGLVDISALGSGMFDFTYTVTPEPNLNACTFAETITLTVFEQPSASFNAPDTACVNTPVLFSNTSTGNQMNTWNFGDGSMPVSDISPVHTFTSTGNFTVELIISSSDGCNDTISQVIDIIELPTGVGFSANPVDQCAPASFDFQGMAMGPGLTYSWLFGNFETSNLLSPSGIFFPQGQSDTTYAVSFTVSNACNSVTIVDSVRVRPIPVASFGTNFNSYCSGQIVDIENNSFGDPDIINWDYGNGNTSTGYEPVDQIYVTDTTVQISITMTLENECGFDTLIRDIIIEPTELNAFYNASDSLLCPGEQVCLTNFATVESTVFYAISTGDTLFTDNPCYTFPGPGIYTITQFSVGCGFDTYSETFTVNGLPPVSINFDPLVCRGSEVNFMSTTNGAIGFNWDFGDGNSSIETNPIHVYDTVGVFPVTLIINSDSCDNSVTSMIEVLELPSISFSFQDSVCAGSPMSFIGVSPTATSFSWDFGDGNVGSGPVLSHVFSNPGSYNVLLTITDANGCMNQEIQQVFVNPVPASNFDFQVLESCAPGEVSFTQTIAGTFDSVEWLFGDGSTSSMTNPVHVYASADTFQVQLIAGFGGICFDTLSREVVIFPTPDPSFSPINASGCEDYAVPFTVDNPLTGVIYEWDFGDGITALEQDPVHTYLNPGSYTVRLIARTTFCADTSFTDVTVFPELLSTGIIENNLCAGESLGSIDLSVSGGSPPFDFDWSTGADTEDVLNLPEGQYRVTITDVNFCTQVDSFVLVDPDSLDYEVLELGIVTCESGSDGFIEIEASGGIPDYQYEWSSGQNTALISNLMMGDYVFTITDANDCVLIDTIPLNENSGIQLDSSVQEITCFGFNDGAIIIQEVIGGVPPHTIQFFSSDTTISRNVFPGEGTQFTNLGPDDYTLLVEDSQGCSETFEVTLIEPFELNLTLPADTTINSGERVALNPIFNRPVEEISFVWTPDDFLEPPGTLNTEARPGESTAYRLSIEDLDGCEASDVIIIDVITRRDVDLPNAFSPNDDGLNDVFYVRSNFPESVNTIRTFRIFDRWGEMVFERQNIDPNTRENGWDGTFRGSKLAPAVFVYTVEVDYYQGETILLKGDVLLVR